MKPGPVEPLLLARCPKSASSKLTSTPIFGVVYGGGVQVGFGNLITPIRNINSFESSISGAPNFSLTGPAAFNGTSTQISDNRTDYYGGGLSAKYDSEVTLTDSLVTGNRAEPPPPRDTGDPRGGGGTSYPGFRRRPAGP